MLSPLSTTVATILLLCRAIAQSYGAVLLQIGGVHYGIAALRYRHYAMSTLRHPA